MRLLLPFWLVRRKAFNLRSWFIPREGRKMTNQNTLVTSQLSSVQQRSADALELEGALVTETLKCVN